MPTTDAESTPKLLLLVAGAKGAVASTLAAAVAALRDRPQDVLDSLTTADKFPFLGDCRRVRFAGWDTADGSMVQAVKRQAVLPETLWRDHAGFLEQMQVWPAPPPDANFQSQVEHIQHDIRTLSAALPSARAVLINLLPAGPNIDFQPCRHLAELGERADARRYPDLVYTLAAVQCGLPVVNFTPNAVELPCILDEARRRGVPMAGRDGKTGQTYLKVVLASALKARSLYVDGWYSVNILGNADGANLKNPERARGKIMHKTRLLDEILGYPVGEHYGESTHTVRIDYYPPRGDAKEAWDVIDFRGLFGLPMSMRLNLQGRDSILAAPMALDLARWMAAVQRTGRAGLIPELGFYFKKPLGEAPAITFQDQLRQLDLLERRCLETVAPPSQP